MAFGTVDERFWTDEKSGAYSDSGKLLALYLLTCKHRTLIGCYHLPMEYICADLKWTADQAAMALSELAAGERPFLARDKTGWTVIVNFLRYQKLTSPNHFKALDFQLSRLPPQSPIFPIVCHSLSMIWRDEWHRRPKVLEATADLLKGSLEATPKLPFTPAPAPAPAPEPKIDSSSGETATPSRKRAQATAAKLPSGWVPNSDQVAYAEKLGLVNGSVQREATKFEAYWTIGKGSGTRRSERGWSQTWITWIGKAATDPQNSRGHHGHENQHHKSSSDSGSGFAGLRSEARQAARGSGEIDGEN